jgi:hypothetical protein
MARLSPQPAAAGQKRAQDAIAADHLRAIVRIGEQIEIDQRRLSGSALASAIRPRLRG